MVGWASIRPTEKNTAKKTRIPQKMQFSLFWLTVALHILAFFQVYIIIKQGYESNPAGVLLGPDVDMVRGELYLDKWMNTSKVIVIKGKGVVGTDAGLDPSKILEMLSRGFRLLTGASDAREALGRIFAREDRIGIKINTIGGRRISTRPELSLSLAELLIKNGWPERNMVIWDRTNRELKEAGYSLSDRPNGLKIFATDTSGAGYETEIFAHRNIGSLFSTIQTNFVTASISLAILKDHGLAGITAGMKNYFGAIHNPNKYHDSHCDPFIAELFDSKPIKAKHKLSLLDALIVQYHRGPSFHPQWAEPCGLLIFSLDPVAADAVGWRLVEKLRSRKGLPSLIDEGREPVFLASAEKLGLGRAGSEFIEVLEDEV